MKTRPHATTLLPHPPRRRGGGVADCGEGAAAGRRGAIGVLMQMPRAIREWQADCAAFREGLAQAWMDRGLATSDRLSLERRRYRPPASLCGRVGGLEPDVITCRWHRTLASLPSRRLAPSRSCSRASDPVAAGIVASLARPGGKSPDSAILSQAIGAKWLECSSRLRPASRAWRSFMIPAQFHMVPNTCARSRRRRRSLGVQLIAAAVHNAAEIERAIACLRARAERWSDRFAVRRFIDHVIAS